MNMNFYLIVFGMIACSNAYPADYIDDGKLSYGLKFSEQYEYIDPSKESDENPSVSSGIFTKYPENPDDDFKPESVEIETREKRDTIPNENDASIDVNQQQNFELSNVNRLERKAIDSRIGLRGFINAVEKDLIGRAQAINGQIRYRRSIESETSIEQFRNENTTNQKIKHDKLFDEINNSTRPEQKIGEKNAKITLDGVVKAVESTLFNSAKNVNKRSTEDCTDENGSKNVKYAVEHLDSFKDINKLDLLSSITFKPISNESDDSSEEETNSTTESSSVHRTNLTVVHSSNSVKITPDPDSKSIRVQHQQIQKTIFHSNLAIFPTISPHKINAPLPTTDNANDITTLSPGDKDDSSSTSKPAKIRSLTKAEILKEKIAEIQAEPVILSQF